MMPSSRHLRGCPAIFRKIKRLFKSNMSLSSRKMHAGSKDLTCMNLPYIGLFLLASLTIWMRYLVTRSGIHLMFCHALSAQSSIYTAVLLVPQILPSGSAHGQAEVQRLEECTTWVAGWWNWCTGRQQCGQDQQLHILAEPSQSPRAALTSQLCRVPSAASGLPGCYSPQGQYRALLLHSEVQA